MRRQNFRSQNFRDPINWRKQVPKTNRESNELTTIFGPPRCEQNGAWRLCLATTSLSKILAAQVGRRRFERRTANPTNLPQFWAHQAGIQTLRGAYAALKFPLPKFSRTKLAEEGSKDKPRIRPISHDFLPPALRPKRCVAPLLRKNFGSQNFRGPPFEEEGSEDNLAKTKFPR